MSNEEKMLIIERLMEEIKQQGSREWNVLYEYFCCIESENEEKDREIEKLKQDIENLKQDIEDNYRPISRAEQYDMGECNFH